MPSTGATLKPASKRRAALPDSTQAERAAVLAALHPVVQMLGRMVGPNVEVVLHDLSMPERSVTAIANGHVTGRTIGSSILSGPKDDKAFAAAKRELNTRGQPTHSLVEEYPTENSKGQRLKSATVIFRDAEGMPFAALCLNADMTVVQLAHSWLERLLGPTAEPESTATETPQFDLLMKDVIGDAVRTTGKPVQMMKKEEKIHAVDAMMRRGLFMTRGGVDRAAAALNVSRFTIYNYLEELRRRNEANGQAAR